jgi:hypothetical protein
MIDAEDEGSLERAIAYLSEVEPQERSEEQDAYDVRVCERFDGPFDDDAPASIRRATTVYLYTNYKQGSDDIESQELDVYDEDDASD